VNTFVQTESVEAAALDAILPELDVRTRAILERRRTEEMPYRRGWLIRRALLAADIFGLTVAFLVSMLVFGESTVNDRVSSLRELLIFAGALPLWIVLTKLYGLYDRDEERTDHSTTDDVVGVFHLVTVGTWLLYIGGLATGLTNPPIERLITFWIAAVAAITVARAVARSSCHRSPAYLQNTIIVGAGDVGQLTARKILNHHEYGINVVGFVDDEPKERRDDLEHLTVLGGPDRLRELVQVLDVERVIVAFSNETDDALLDLVRQVQDLDVQIDIVPRLFDILGPSVGIHTIEGIPLVGLPPLRLARSSRLLKRGLDLVVSSVALTVLAPVLIGIAIAIKLDSRGPVMFRQTRRGRSEGVFRIYKFRTMSVDAEARKNELAHLNMHLAPGGDPRMFKIPDDPRVTRVGGFLRRTRLDELPQLFNVVKGEMSLVGPRPIILDEDQYVAGWARRRLDLRPGMTGLWQVLGASDIPFDEMTKLDYRYVTNWSLAEDLRLIMLTIPSILRRRAAY
jgi:exopolysaccharide biosynthesis polyprenyl glycosylphosphotransferase